MSTLVALLVRVSVLGAALLLVTKLPLAEEDALGTGLLAFAGLVVASGAWALVDGARHGARTAVRWWAPVAVVLAIGWWLVFAATQRDSTMSFTDLLASDAALVPFVVALVLVPAAVGAGLGTLVRTAGRDD